MNGGILEAGDPAAGKPTGAAHLAGEFAPGDAIEVDAESGRLVFRKGMRVAA